MSVKVAGRPRGLCPTCKRSIQLTAGGLIRHHGGEGGPGTYGRRTYRCDGAGWLPLACAACGRRLSQADNVPELLTCTGCNADPAACRCANIAR